MAAEDKQALVAALAISHGEQLRRFLLRRIRNASDVPDIIQEVFLRMLRVPDHEVIRSPEAYLFTVAGHVAQQHTLRQAAAPLSLELTNALATLNASSTPDPVLEIEGQECLTELYSALNQLSPKTQATFLFHRRDGLTLEEIGSRLGVSRDQAKKYLARALLHMRQRLEETE